MMWLIGNKGMLGTELAAALSQAGLEYIGTDREMDILDAPALSVFISGKKIDWIINCAAYTSVEKAETEETLAERINAQGPKNIAALAKVMGAKLVHLSTDYVFDGTGTRPYREDDPMAPLGAYGRTKATGEDFVRQNLTEHVILRTAWLYGPHGPNFVYTMLKLMASKDKIGVVHDQKGSPTYTADLAAAIVAIITSKSPVYGTFHFTDLGETNWHEFASEIQKQGRSLGLLSKNCEVAALTTAEYGAKVQRPAYSVLSKDKILDTYKIPIPEWRQSLDTFIKRIASDPAFERFYRP